ncbi:MAG: TIGR03617 family F420-dependent LLM class oxidoreductase [Pseudomonadota bacterium]
MKIDILLPAADPKDVVERATEFEKLGFDCVWTFEAAHDAFLPLSHAAAVTKKLEVGTNIAVAFARTPFSIAQTAWDMQKNSGGRFHLGLGTQVRAHVERRFSAQFDRPAARVTDYIRCVRAIWDCYQNGTKPKYNGEFYQFNLMNPFFQPGPIDHPKIPIYLAGVNPRMCRAAGEVADGFHVHPMHTASYLQEVVKPSLNEGAKLRNASVDDMTLYSPVFVITGNSQNEMDELEQTVRQQISFYATTPSYGAVLAHHGYDQLGRKLGGLMREGKVEEMGRAIPEAFLERVAIIGPPNEIGSRLRERYDGVLDRVALYMTMGDDAKFEQWSDLIEQIHQ